MTDKPESARKFAERIATHWGEDDLDDIVRSILPVANAGWTRKQDAGDFEIYELAVPKRNTNV